MSLFTSQIDIEKVKAKQFLDKMEEVMPWGMVIQIIEPYYIRPGERGRPQKEIKSLLKMMCLQQWYTR